MAKIFFIAVASSVLLTAIISGRPEEKEKRSDVPIEHIFKHKIVYAEGSNHSVTEFQKDCQGRGGRLNTCGSMCDDTSGPVVCAQVCVLTCEFKKIDRKK